MSHPSIYVAGIPAWWEPKLCGSQIEAVAERLLKILPPTDTPPAIPGVLLYGPPGTGKTSSACAVLYAWGLAGKTAAFLDFGELMLSVRSSWRKDAERTTEQIIRDAMRPKILLLDDVGKRATPEDQETLSTLVNGRINRGVQTIITTNCDLASPEGRAQFMASGDSRILERYRRYDIQVLGENLRARGMR
jgi:DNA replication protein DnaC